MKKIASIIFLLITISLFNDFSYSQDGDGDQNCAECPSKITPTEEADSNGWFWKPKDVKCTVKVITTYGGGPFPYSKTYEETRPGIRTDCVDGWFICISGHCW